MAGRQSATAATLPRLNLTSNYVTGISSGGYMATQLQVAYSSRFRGAGIFAGGPYWCAQGTLTLALQACTANTVPTSLDKLEAQTDAYAQSGEIDPTANLARHRVWQFHGTKDPTVLASVSDDLASYYRHYGAPLTYRDTTAAGHAWISPLGPNPCPVTSAPYINACDWDAEADMLATMLGSVKAPAKGSPRGTLTAFSQDAYAAGAQAGAGDPTRAGAAAVGLGRTGYVYVPSTCAKGNPCRLVLALHGCLQTADQIGTTFVDKSNLARYADTNALVLLYPQATPDTTFGNPKGCWDWWGYLGANDGAYATKRGPQMVSVMNMVTALGG